MSAALFALREGVVYIEVEDGTSRLLDLGNRFYGLSAVATRMLRATLDAGPDAAAERLAREYGVSLERVRGDLATFLVDLERKQLIRRTGDRRIAARAGRAVTCAAVVSMLWGARLVPGQRGKAWLLLALAWLNCRLLGWTHTVEAWRTGCPRRATSAADPKAAMRAIDTTIRSAAASHPLPTECKERALTTWALARIAGVPVELVVGVHLFPLKGHCWCAYNGAVYSDDSERCAPFKPVWWCS
jgi:Transglutaminase-like superfamily/Coenzyme PQQ synthesis protein D (PqqD)